MQNIIHSQQLRHATGHTVVPSADRVLITLEHNGCLIWHAEQGKDPVILCHRWHLQGAIIAMQDHIAELTEFVPEHEYV